jgi:hypothetical protein
MSQWVRLWEDMPTDPKWRVIAKRSGRSISEVMAVFNFMMTNAGANATERGKLKSWEDDDVAAALDIESENVVAIREAMQGKVLDGDSLKGWERRQPKREDNAAERAKAWREAKKEAAANASERTETQPSAPKRPDTDTDTDTDNKIAQVAIDDFWKVCPRKVGKGAAKKAWKAAILKTSPETIIAAMRIFAAKQAGQDEKYIPHPATWLNAERWQDGDLQPKGPEPGAILKIPLAEDSPGFKAWEKHFGKSVARTDVTINGRKVRGWYFASEFPPTTPGARP